MLKRTNLISLIVLCLFIAGGVLFTSCKTTVEIVEDPDGEWRIYDKEGNNRGILKVKQRRKIMPRHKIKFKVTDSDMEFFLPLELNEYFTYDENLFVDTDSLHSGVDGPRELRRTQTIEAGESLVLKVRRDAPADTIDYDIYVLDADKYVIGNSPPYIIIQRPYSN